MRADKMAICTSGEPVSVSLLRCSPTRRDLSSLSNGMRTHRDYHTPWSEPCSGSARSAAPELGVAWRRDERGEELRVERALGRDPDLRDTGRGAGSAEVRPHEVPQR